MDTEFRAAEPLTEAYNKLTYKQREILNYWTQVQGI